MTTENYELFVSLATIKSYPAGATFSYRTLGVETINAKLKRLREEAGMSQPEVAQALGVAKTTYASKEDPAKFKGPLLPVTYATRLAQIYSKRGVDPAKVLALAGITGEPVDLSGNQQPTVLLPVTLPSADVLAEAFQAILEQADLPAGDGDSLARVLAEHFPAALEGALFRMGQRRPPSAPALPAPSPEARDSK
jgi:DNA-binding XRE family transcriptional regulator